jgi:hypothetical protein
VQAAVERYEQALRLLESHDEAAAERAWLLCNLAEAFATPSRTAPSSCSTARAS